MLGPRPILCSVLNGAALGADPYTRACDLFAAGIDWIQLRDRSLSDRTLWQIACALVAARDEGVRSDDPSPRRRVIVNKRVDLARAVGADGVHLGFDSLSPDMSRRELGSGALVGVSLHSSSEVEAAAGGVIDYVQLAPIWDPLSKPATRAALGLECLAEACRSGIPVIAQGGVDAVHAKLAIRAGAAGVAVTGILASADSPRNPLDAVGPIRESLDRGAP